MTEKLLSIESSLFQPRAVPWSKAHMVYLISWNQDIRGPDKVSPFVSVAVLSFLHSCRPIPEEPGKERQRKISRDEQKEKQGCESNEDVENVQEREL